MKPAIDKKMEDFINDANRTLKSFSKKVNLFIVSSLVILIAMLVMIVDTRVEVVKKADASSVVFKQNARVVEQLRLSNQERNFAVVVDTFTTMDIIKKNNQNFFFLVEGIYDINYRGDK